MWSTFDSLGSPNILGCLQHVGLDRVADQKRVVVCQVIDVVRTQSTLAVLVQKRRDDVQRLLGGAGPLQAEPDHVLTIACYLRSVLGKLLIPDRLRT